MLDINYKLSDGDVSLTKLINFIAQVVHHEDDKRTSKMKIRSSVRYARDKGELVGLLNVGASMGEQVNVNAADFFYWAIKKWPVLKDINGLPKSYRHVFAKGKVVCESNAIATGIVIPGDRSTLESLFIKSETERCLLVDEKKQLELRLKNCEKELNEMVQKKKEIGNNRKNRIKNR